MGREDRDAMSKMSQWNQSPVYIHSLDADICLKVPVHFCYSSPIGVMRCDGGSPDGRGRFSPIIPLTAFGGNAGSQSWAATKSSHALPPSLLFGLLSLFRLCL